MSASHVIEIALLLACAVPALLFAVLSISSLFGPLSERSAGAFVGLHIAVMTAALALALGAYLVRDASPMSLSYGDWFVFGSDSFAFVLLADGFSLGFALLAASICGVVAAFSCRYLHREPGFHRYLNQFALFATGMALIALAGSIEVLFAGWELVGLSSALLVGFFHDRRMPVRNALRIFAVYRLTDAAMLCAAVLLHHWEGSGGLLRLFWHDSSVPLALGSNRALVLSLLVLLAVAGKSALLPFSGWLPRAMEGPTPSSAVYYGALSIHAGCFLLLRFQPVLSQSAAAQGLAIFVGAGTAIYATLAAYVQSDIKSALALACLTQVGIIVVEIALGFTTLAFIHLAGHACFRLLQFLSAPGVLHDLHGMEIAQHSKPVAGGQAFSLVYFASLERGFVDALIDRWIVAPFLTVAAGFDRIDRWLTGSGKPTTADPTSESE